MGTVAVTVTTWQCMISHPQQKERGRAVARVVETMRSTARAAGVAHRCFRVCMCPPHALHVCACV